MEPMKYKNHLNKLASTPIYQQMENSNACFIGDSFPTLQKLKDKHVVVLFFKENAVYNG